MSVAATDTKHFIEEYFRVMSGQPKTKDVIDSFVTAANLKEHILQAETAFPGYQLNISQMIAEGDTAAVRATMEGTHKGTFAGIGPTGKLVTVEGMMFYRVSDGRIVEFWMQMDMASLLSQLNG